MSKSSKRKFYLKGKSWLNKKESIEIQQPSIPSSIEYQVTKKKKKKKFKNCCCDCFLKLLIIIFFFLAWAVKEHWDPEDAIFRKILSNEVLVNMTGKGIEKPGITLAKEGLHVYHPVIFIPGIVSTGLEVWQAKPCAKKHFRERFWGTSLMIRKLLLTKECWLEHVCLNQSSWLDPEGIKLRPASGLSSADYLVGEYWVWGKVIENLAEIGYDESNMWMASYDWRLPYKYLETRDHYFSRLKIIIEMMKKTNQHKVVIITHSMGALVFQYFMKWVESNLGGNGGENWIADNIDSFLNIAGPMLGVPKSLSSVLSGEMRDTAELSTVLQFIKENLLSKKELMMMFRSFGSIASMIPKGGNAIWGNGTYTPENITLSNLLTFKGDNSKNSNFKKEKNKEDVKKVISCPQDQEDENNKDNILNDIIKSEIGEVNYTINEALKLLEDLAPDYMNRVNSFYSFGVGYNFSDEKYNDPKYWSNPLESPLPKASNMKIYCLYGVGKDTERAYYYERKKESYDGELSIDTTQNNKDSKINFGVQLTEGDGTVPLISLGYMCVKGWKNPIYNPSGMKVITREYQHILLPIFEASQFGIDSVIRGGASTAEHVDIMGNYNLLEDILRVVSGNNKSEEDRIFSDVKKYSDRVIFEES